MVSSFLVSLTPSIKQTPGGRAVTQAADGTQGSDNIVHSWGFMGLDTLVLSDLPDLRA